MAKVYDELDHNVTEFIGRQKMFFVGTAPPIWTASASRCPSSRSGCCVPSWPAEPASWGPCITSAVAADGVT